MAKEAESSVQLAHDEPSRMRSAARQRRIRELFASEEFIDSETLCRKLGVSDSTIRRDLIELERNGLVRRVYGGAMSMQTRNDALDFSRLTTISPKEKVRIGKAAAALVRDGQNLILAPGSTVVEVAKNLLGRPIQVVTNSIPVAQVFWDCKTVEVTMTGGYRLSADRLRTRPDLRADARQDFPGHADHGHRRDHRRRAQRLQ